MDAVIDIGSNSVRLMLDEGKPLNDKKLVSTWLGKGLAHTGVLSAEAMDSTAAAVSAFCREAKERGATEIFLFATEAVRSARNGEEFTARLERETGLKTDVISGEIEARLALTGALSDQTDELTVIDIGGASVEIVRGDFVKLTYARSEPLGALRLLDLAGEDRASVERYLASALPAFGIVSGTEAAAIGGTATALASMDLRQSTYVPSEVHGHVLTADALRRLCDEIFASTDRRRDFPTLSESRAKIIGHGALTLSALLEYLDLDYVTVSEHDNMEGYLKYVRRK